MKLEDKIKIMQAFSDGKDIESKLKSSSFDEWIIDSNPDWNWKDFEYRIKISKNITYPFFKKRKGYNMVVLFTGPKTGYSLHIYSHYEYSEYREYSVGSSSTNWTHHDEDIWEDIEDFKIFPLYVKSKNGTIAEFISLKNGIILKNGSGCDWNINDTTSSLLFLLGNSFKLIEKPEFLKDKTIKIEKWLIYSTFDGSYYTIESSNIDVYLELNNKNDKKIKLLDKYKVEK